MKKITLVNQVTGPLFIDIANAYESMGFETTLHTGLVEETYASLNVGIKIKKSQQYNRKNAVLRMFTWFLFFIQVFFKLIFEKKDVPLLLVSNPPFGPLLGLIYNKVFKRPYYVLIYDIYPDALVELNYFSADSWIVKIWSRINSRLFEKAERVFTISDGMKQKIEAYYNGGNIHVIHNWVDPDFIKPIEKVENWFVKKHNLVGKKVVLYSGNLGITHDIESIVESAKELENDDRIHFLIIGSGAKEEKVKQLISKYQLTNVTLLPFQPSNVIPYSMTSGDIGIVTLAKGAGNLSVPSKTYYLMSAGLAIIAISEEPSEIASLVNTNIIGNVVVPNNPIGLANTILELVNNSNLLTLYKKNALETSKLFTPQNANRFVDYFL